jgi:hypothetical protein
MGAKRGLEFRPKGIQFLDARNEHPLRETIPPGNHFAHRTGGGRGHDDSVTGKTHSGIHCYNKPENFQPRMRHLRWQRHQPSRRTA